MKKILLIEDNTDIREMTADLLEMSNYEVTTAENGKIGVEKALLLKPDLVICDIMMPVLDGYGVLHVFHQNESLMGIPFIFLTAKTERVDFRKGMDMGADDYITKPFTEIELLNAIESRLKRAAQIQTQGVQVFEKLNNIYNEAQQLGGLEDLILDKKSHYLKKRQVIFNEGETPSKIYFLKAGKIKTYQINSDGKSYTTALINEGNFFGYLSVLEDCAYQENAETLEDSELVYIQKQDFLNLIYKDKNTAGKFIKLLANEVQQKEQMLTTMAYSSLRKRTATMLINLYEKFPKDSQTIGIKISREELASLVGTATESLIRTLSDFKQDNILELKGSEIVIQNLAKLKQIKS